MYSRTGYALWILIMKISKARKIYKQTDRRVRRETKVLSDHKNVNIFTSIFTEVVGDIEGLVVIGDVLEINELNRL